MPLVPLFLLNCGRVATFVKLVGVIGNASFKCDHYVHSPMWVGILAMEQHFVVVGSVWISCTDSGCVESCVTMESFLSSKFTQHTTGPVLPGNIWNVLKSIIALESILKGKIFQKFTNNSKRYRTRVGGQKHKINMILFEYHLFHYVFLEDWDPWLLCLMTTFLGLLTFTEPNIPISWLKWPVTTIRDTFLIFLLHKICITIVSLWPWVYIRVFHKLYENANFGIFIFTVWKQKNSSDKMLPQWE